MQDIALPRWGPAVLQTLSAWRYWLGVYALAIRARNRAARFCVRGVRKSRAYEHVVTARWKRIGLLAPDYDRNPNPMLALETAHHDAVVPSTCGACESWMQPREPAAGRLTGSIKEQRPIAVDFCFEMLAARRCRPWWLTPSALPLPDGFADVTICAFAMGYAAGMPA